MRSVQPKRLLLHGITILCLLTWTAGFLHAMVRVEWLVPKPFMLFAYQTMAPYQQYSPRNGDVVFEGLKNGVWERIPSNRYIAYSSKRSYAIARFSSFRRGGDEALNRATKQLANRILEREREIGNEFDDVRIVSELWPKSPDGYTARRTPAITTREVLGTAL